jgi:hypothetical protein
LLKDAACIDGIDADVLSNRWHSLGVIVNDDHFAVSLDQKPLFTAFDRSRMKDGRVGLRTEEDNVVLIRSKFARFHQGGALVSPRVDHCCRRLNLP